MMNRLTSWPKKFALTAALISLASCATYVEQCWPIVKKDVNTKKTFAFTDHNRSSEIKLKTTYAQYYSVYAGSIDVTLAYIIDVYSSLSDVGSYVYLRLNDAEGFEITRYYVSNVASHFRGALKGNINIKSQDYFRLAGAELVLFNYADSNKHDININDDVNINKK